MKYFTPELYQQFNSFDREEAESADEAWDRAEAAYKERLAGIRKNMPVQALALAELCLHDALVVSREEQIQPESSVVIISSTIGDQVISLIYSLRDHVTVHEAPKGWRFSKLQEQWLYDEVDVLDENIGGFVHRILFSTGITLEIPFSTVIIHKFKVPAAPKLAKQIA
jgi:hypothetical protein